MLRNHFSSFILAKIQVWQGCEGEKRLSYIIDRDATKYNPYVWGEDWRHDNHVFTH